MLFRKFLKLYVAKHAISCILVSWVTDNEFFMIISLDVVSSAVPELHMRNTSYCELWENVSPDRWAVNIMPMRYARDLLLICCINLIIIKFPYNARSDGLKQRALSENKEQVNDIKLAFKFLLRNFDKFDPNKTSHVRLRQNQYKRTICQQ